MLLWALPSSSFLLTTRKLTVHASKYERRVSFNTFDNPDATDLAFNIGLKHRNCNYTQRSRTFLCGTDDNDYSYDAVEWLIEELVEDGDDIICLRVVDKDSIFVTDAAMQKETYKKEAEQLLDKISKKNKARKEGEKEKSIGLGIEFAVGKVPDVFQRMVHPLPHHEMRLPADLLQLRSPSTPPPAS